MEDDYNTVRPHSGLGNLAPLIYAGLSAPKMQRDGTLRSWTTGPWGEGASAWSQAARRAASVEGEGGLAMFTPA